MALDYGYTIRIQQNGILDPNSSFTNQWQRKLSGSNQFVDISGATSTTYKVTKDDKSAKLRLSQKFASEDVLFSNELQVTSAAPPVGWIYKGKLNADMSHALAYSPEIGSFAIGLRGSKAKFSSDGGDTWITKTGNAIDVAIGADTAKSGGTNYWVFGGYGGGFGDDNVSWISESLGSWQFSTGFPRSTYIYGVFKMTDSIYMGIDINGDVWATDGGPGGSFSKTGQNIATSYVSFKGKRDSNGKRLGTGQSAVYRYESASGTGSNSLTYTKGTCTFSGNNKSVSDIHHHGGLYVAVGSESQLFTSSNFTSWTRKSVDNLIPYNTSLQAVTFAGGKWWIAGGYLGQLYLLSSTTGSTWRKETLPDGLSTGAGMGGPSSMASNDSDQAVWTFSQTSSPYSSYYCILDS